MKALVAILLAFPFLVTGAYAQTAGARGADTASHHAMMQSEGKHSTDVERHIKDLHAKLKITAAEESQWESVAQTMRENARELDEAIAKREGGASAVDDLNAYGEMVQAHADAIKKLATAFSSLYATMPEEQKKVADQLFAQRISKKSHVAMKSPSQG
jgi:protein CpxP